VAGTGSSEPTPCRSRAHGGGTRAQFRLRKSRRVRPVGVLVLVHDHDTRALTDKLNDIRPGLMGKRLV